MLAEYSTVLRRAVIGADLAVVAGAFLLAYVLRDRLLWTGIGQLGPFGPNIWVLAVALLIWGSCLGALGFYRSFRYRRRAEVLGTLTKAHLVASLLLLSVLFVARRSDVSRLLTQLFLVLSFVGLAAEKMAILAILRRWRRKGHNFREALVVGDADRAARYIRFLYDHPHFGVRVTGTAVDDGEGPDDEVAGVPIIGRVKDLPEIMRSHPTDEVVFTIGTRELPQVEEYLDLCQDMGVTSRLVLDLPQRQWTRQDLAWVDGVGILSLDPVRLSPWRLATKRVIDVAGALVGLSVFGVVYAWYAPRIRRDSPGPVLFSQVRVGRNGRLFALYKLRTMYVDAEARREDLAAANEMRGAVFKVRDDPRVTPLGRRLRARHLDELPQFWNVLRGEMSLVGTRPPTLEEVGAYRPHHRRRLSMKPGITGLWQLAGNQEVRDFEDVVKLDCRYIDTWTIQLDIWILARTVVKVIQRNAW